MCVTLSLKTSQHHLSCKELLVNLLTLLIKQLINTCATCLCHSWPGLLCLFPWLHETSQPNSFFSPSRHNVLFLEQRNHHSQGQRGKSVILNLFTKRKQFTECRIISKLLLFYMIRQFDSFTIEKYYQAIFGIHLGALLDDLRGLSA